MVEYPNFPAIFPLYPASEPSPDPTPSFARACDNNKQNIIVLELDQHYSEFGIFGFIFHKKRFENVPPLKSTFRGLMCRTNDKRLTKYIKFDQMQVQHFQGRHFLRQKKPTAPQCRQGLTILKIWKMLSVS